MIRSAVSASNSIRTTASRSASDSNASRVRIGVRVHPCRAQNRSTAAASMFG